MKKIFALALAAAAIFTVQAQEQDVKANYEQGKKLEKVYDKAKENPDVASAEALMQAFDLYNKVMTAEQGSQKPKYSEKIMKQMTKRAMEGDFQKAAIALFNGGKQFPEAYGAFMISGVSSKMTGLVPDTVYAIDFFNAGNSAYGRDFEAAAVAYDAAIEANSTDPNAYIYAIGSRQNLLPQKPELKDKLSDEIHAVAQKGIERFGYEQDFLFNNYLQYYFDKNDFATALTELEKAEKANPANANVYRLRGIISNAKGDYLATVPAYVKMSELTDNFDYLYSAAGDLNTLGKAIMGKINNPTPEAKQQILDIFNTALNIARKASTAPNADAQKVQNEIEDIEYGISNANKL